MADLADSDPRAVRWEARFRTPIIVAALAVLPLLALSLGSSPSKGDARTVAFVVAGVLATFGVNHLRRERAA